MNKETYVIGVDNGNSHTKTRSHSYRSGLKELDGEVVTNKNFLEYNNRYFSLSSERSAISKNKAGNDDMFLLTMIGVAKELQTMGVDASGGVDVALVIGTPVTHFTALKEPYKQYFLERTDEAGYVHFKFEGEHYAIRLVDVKVLVQGYPAVAIVKSPLKRYSRSYIIDIGGYTVDVVALDSGKYSVDTQESLDMGVITLFNEIKTKLQSRPDLLNLTEEQIEEIILDDPNADFLKQAFPDVVELIKGEASKHATKILKTLLEKQIDLRVNPSFFVGGGSLLLQKHFKESQLISQVLSTYSSDENQNAIGYEEIYKASQRKAAK